MTKSKEPKVEEVNGLFAFWRYDQYPYVLGAEITRMNDRGDVYAPAYEAWFHPVKLMPVKAGKALDDRLLQMRNEHRAAHVMLDAEWNKTLFDLIPEARSPDQTYAGFPRKVDDKK